MIALVRAVIRLTAQSVKSADYTHSINGFEATNCGVRAGSRSSSPPSRGPFPLARKRRSMRYRVEFLDRSDNVIRELQADARSGGSPLLRAWPAHAIRVRVIYPSGYVSTSKILA